MELQMDYSQRTNAEVCDDYGNVGSSIQQEWYHGAQAGFEKTNGFSHLGVLGDKKKGFLVAQKVPWGWVQQSHPGGWVGAKAPWGWVGAKGTLGVGQVGVGF